MNYKIVGIAGQKRAGKDLTSDYLAKKLNEKTNLNWDRVAFANAVKQVFEDSFGKTRQFTEKWKVIDSVPPGLNIPVRKALQQIGDGFRQIRSEIWIDIGLRGDNNKVISDVRYLNEANMIRHKQGFNVLVWRPGFENDDPCQSEAQIRPLVDWCAKNLERTGPIPDDLDSSYFLKGEEVPTVVNQIKLFDYFLVNGSGVEELYRRIDEQLIPYLMENNK